jgi:catechol 2,3-dioxygenase-like lactoylglutathione lyase family enzyme
LKNKFSQQGLRFHHIGCLTEDIERSIASYSELFGFNRISRIFNISDQEVKVCFIETSPDTFLELIEPTGVNPTLRKLIKSNNLYYHIGYLTPEIESAIESFIKKDFKLVNTFHSEAFQNRKCAFLYSPDMHLIELIQE